MNINRDNYETYLVDLMDGTLSGSDQKELQLFLEANTDIWDEFRGMDTAVLTPEHISFPHKEKLKQNNLDEQDFFNEQAVAYIENELTETEVASFDSYIDKNTEKKKAFILFKLTVLKPDLNIVFPNKNALYKKAKIVPLFVNIGRIAAIAAIFVLAFFVLNPFETNENNDNNLVATHITINEAKVDDSTPVISEDSKLDHMLAKAVVTNEPQIHTKSKTETKLVNKVEASSTKKDVDHSYLVQTENKDELIEPISTERDVLKQLKPKKPRQNRYILVLKPTLVAADNGLLADNSLGKMDRLAKTGENILKKGSEMNLGRNTIEKGVLNVLKLASNERISYEINNNGKVSKINVNSDLLAFSLPIRNKQ